MPFGFGSGGRPPYKDLERAPLSARDDDDDDGDMPLPPYSDTPPSPSGEGEDLNGDDAPLNGGRVNGGRGGGANGHKSIAIAQDGARDKEEDDYDDDDGFGERESFRGSAKARRGHSPRYRGGLVLAYLRYWLTCGCFGRCIACCEEDAKTRRTRRNIGGVAPVTEASKRCRCAKRVAMGLFYIALLVTMLVCALAIGYIVARDGSPFAPDAAAASEDHANSNVDNGNKLPPPPDNLHDICTDWITAAGRDKCKSECHAGLCCALPASDKRSCWEEQASECATYRSACMALELHPHDDGDVGGGGESGGDGSAHDGSGPGPCCPAPLPSTTSLDAPLPSLLNEICSPSSLKTPEGFGMCSDSCRPSRCCHPETYGCEVASEDKRWCDGYEEPCANVAESWRGSGHVAAPSVVPPNPPKAPGSGGGGGPSPANPGGTGPVSAPGSSLPSQSAVNHQVLLACNAGNLNPPDACVEACYAGACCYVSDAYPPIEQWFDILYGFESSPFRTVKGCQDQVGFCQQFGACEHLNHLVDASGWHSDEVLYDLDIAEVCRVEYVARFGALECSNVCQPAHCCFSGEYECKGIGLENLNCHHYKHCAVLYPESKEKKTMTELFKMARHIDEVCAEDLVDTAKGRRDCQGLCKDRLCCFEDGAYGCAGDPGQNCLAYAGCVSLVETPESYVGNGTPKGTNGGTTGKNNDGELDLAIDTFIKALEEACSADSLKMLEGIQKCHDKCQTHLCCFAEGTGSSGDCEGAHPQACDAYKPCERLVSPPSTPTATSPPPDNLDLVNEKVSKVCDLPVNPRDIDQAWVTGCHAACAPRLCCFLDPKIGSNCRGIVDARECSAYGPCDVLIDQDTGKEMTDAKTIEDELIESDLETVCNDGVAKDPTLYDQCKDRCMQRSCCFEDEPTFSCYGMEKEWCEEFKACSYVALTFMTGGSGSKWSGKPNSFVDNPAPKSDTFIDVLEEACSENSLKTLEGIQKCHDKCQTHLCCFAIFAEGSGSSGDCEGAHPQACDAYKPCDRLVKPPPTPTATPPGLADNLDSVNKMVSKACDLPANPHDINQLWVTGCHAACAPRLCCFIDPKIGSNCRAIVGVKECSAYGPCDVLINPRTGTEMMDAKTIEDELIDSDLETICNVGVVKDSNLYDQCEDRCMQRSCCFEDEPMYSCYGMEKEWCEEFKACSYVDFTFMTEGSGSKWSGKPNSFVDNPTPNQTPATVLNFGDFESFQTKCAPNILLQNWDTCKEFCQNYECCFRTIDSCYPQNEAECDKFYICEEFFEDMDGGDGESSGQATNSNSSPQPTFNGFEAEMEAACSPDALKTLQGVKKCYNKCQAHLCCVPADAMERDFDCSDTYPEECNEYYLCENLVSYFNLWTPPSKSFDPFAVKNAVDGACTLPKGNAPVTEEWVANCRQACEARMCCFTHPSLGTNCVETLGQDECDDYAACKNLIGGDEGHNNRVDDFCTSEVSINDDLFVECLEECDKRSCCFQDVPAYSCYGMEREWCNEYKECSRVDLTFTFLDSATSGKSNQTVTKPGSATKPHGIDDLCNKGVSSDNGLLARCREECKERLCCFEDDSKLSCYEEDEEWCREYEACGLVGYTFFSTTDTTTAVKKITDLCNKDVSSDNGLFARCREECKERWCCFEDNSELSCYEQDEDWCREYEACALVGYTFFSTTDSTEANQPGSVMKINDLCKTDASSDKGLFARCREECKERLCCFEDNLEFSCYEDDEEWCREYEACALVGYTFFTTTNANQPGTAKVIDESKVVNLEQIGTKCSREYLLAFGLEDCKQLCVPVTCCFSFAQCSYPTPSDCPKVSACNNFFNPASEDLLIEKMCSEEELEENELPCKDRCEPYECCFTNGRCVSSIKAKCPQHEPCRKYFDNLKTSTSNKPGSATEPIAINNFCNKDVSSDNGLLARCREECKERLCCFEDNSEFSCYEDDEEWCREYEACALVGYTFFSTTENKQGSGTKINDLCNEDVLSNNGFARCREGCKERLCCFEDNSEFSCYEQDEDWCKEYEACALVGYTFFSTTDNKIGSTMKPIESNVNQPTSNLPHKKMMAAHQNSGSGRGDSLGSDSFQDLCSEANLEQNWDYCKRHCTPYACCFKRQNSCYQDNRAECEENYICEEFFVDSGGDDATPTTLNAGSGPSTPNNMQQLFKTLCSESNLARNWETCRNHCSEFQCCFSSSRDSCYQDRKLECDEHYICEEFYEEAELRGALASETSKAAVSLAAMQYRCSTPRLEKHLDDCTEWCVAHECCFDAANSCYLAKRQDCDDHDLCQLVFDHKKRGTQLPGNGIIQSSSISAPTQTTDEGLDATEFAILEKACEIKQLRDNESECKMLCRGSACCFSENSPCSGMIRFCEDHAICSRIFG